MVIERSQSFEHFVSPFGSFCLIIGRDILYLIIGSDSLVSPIECFHRYQVYDTFEVLFGSDRYLYGARIGSEHLFYLCYHFEKVCSRAVHLVYITYTRHIVFICLTPHRLRLRLHASYRTESSHCTIEYSQRALDLYGEVYVSRGVDKIDFILLSFVFPTRSSSSRGDSDTAFLLLFHPVHCSGTVVNFTYFMRKTRIKQYTFGCRSFTGIDVSHNTDVSRKS